VNVAGRRTFSEPPAGGGVERVEAVGVLAGAGVLCAAVEREDVEVPAGGGLAATVALLDDARCFEPPHPVSRISAPSPRTNCRGLTLPA
jgi:hypothetical protein